MQTFSAIRENHGTMIQPYELALYAVNGYDIYQESPERIKVARAGHPEDLQSVALEDNAHTMKLGG